MKTGAYPVLGLALGWFAMGPAVAQQPAPGALRHARLYGVCSDRMLNHVNHDDARAALKVWFDVLAQQKGFILDSKVDILDSLPEIRERLRNHSVDLLMLGIPDFLELESTGLLEPVLTDVRGAQAAAPYSYVLLVNPSSGVSTAAGLRGKNVLIYSRDAHTTGPAWLDVLLGREKLGRAAAFFASAKVTDKAQACILPLFFGAADACVVDEVDLNLAREMNPQLGQLKVLARSRPMLETLIAVPVAPYPYRKELLDAMLSLHQDSRGRQMLMVFKTDRLVRIEPGDLDSAREFWADYHRLTASPPNRGTGPAPSAPPNPPDRLEEGR